MRGLFFVITQSLRLNKLQKELQENDKKERKKAKIKPKKSKGNQNGIEKENQKERKEKEENQVYVFKDEIEKKRKTQRLNDKLNEMKGAYSSVFNWDGKGLDKERNKPINTEIDKSKGERKERKAKIKNNKAQGGKIKRVNALINQFFSFTIKSNIKRVIKAPLSIGIPEDTDTKGINTQGGGGVISGVSSGVISGVIRGLSTPLLKAPGKNGLLIITTPKGNSQFLDRHLNAELHPGIRKEIL